MLPLAIDPMAVTYTWLVAQHVFLQLARGESPLYSTSCQQTCLVKIALRIRVSQHPGLNDPEKHQQDYTNKTTPTRLHQQDYTNNIVSHSRVARYIGFYGVERRSMESSAS